MEKQKQGIGNRGKGVEIKRLHLFFYSLFPIPYPLLLLFILSSLSGCAWLSPKKTISVENSQFSQTGKIIRPRVLDRGGNLAIMPFKAGLKVEANSELDTLALNIVKGVASELEDNYPYYNIVTNDNAQIADLVIKGHIIKKKENSALNRLISRKKFRELEIEMEIRDRETGQIVLIFKTNRKTEKNDVDFRELATMVGNDIGKFILSNNKESQ